MQCAHEGQLVTSSRHSKQDNHTPLPPAQRARNKGAEVIAGILSGNVSLSQREVSILAAHLQGCSSECVGPAELAATLQAAGVLVQGRRSEVIAACGLHHWLIHLTEDLVLMAGGGESLVEVVELLVQTASVLLASAGSTGGHVEGRNLAG